MEKIRRDLKDRIHVETAGQGDQDGDGADSAVGEQGRADETVQLLMIMSRRIGGNITHDGGTDPQIEQSVISSDGENQNPQTVSVVSQVWNDVGRDKDADLNVERQGKP